MTPSTGSANTYSSAPLTLRGRMYRVPINPTLRRRSTSRPRGRELLLQEAKRSIKRLPGRLSGLVYQVIRQHAVRRFRPKRIGMLLVDLDRFECAAEFVAQPCEALA